MAKFSKTKTGKELGSKQFFELIRSIGEAKSKQEEDKIVAKEIASLKTKMQEKDWEKQKKEYVVRVLYCEMLGHNADFGYINCIKLIADTDLLQKRTGYLAVQLTISPESELLYLIVSAIQKDLNASSSLDVCAALNAATKLINPELMPCLITDVRNCLNHQCALVRKKAIVCIHAFWRKDEAGVGDVRQYQQVLCDKDPAVMACTLGFLQDLCFLSPEDNKHLVTSFVDILKQICEHRLTKEYDYHRIPAPWIQIRLLKLLAILCHNNLERSKKAYVVLGEVMRRVDAGLNIGNAVIFECVKTITCLVPDETLIGDAADAISKFLRNPNPNLKYLGITSLSRIVLINPRYAAEHRDIVMDCLEDHDETIKRKTLDLLYAMTNHDSVEVIVGRLIKFLSAAHDVYLKSDLVSNICDLAYRFYPTMEWYILTLNKVIRLGEQFVDNQTVQGMLKMIAEGSEDLEDEVNDKFRLYAVESYYVALDTTDKLPDTLIQIISWVLGEYGFMSKQYSQNDIIDKLCDLLEQTHEETDTRGYIITALMKLTAQMPVPPHVLELVGTFKSAASLALQQRCYEFTELSQHPQLMSGVLPLDGCCEDLEVDRDLSFLDNVVEIALARGAKNYRKNYFEDDESNEPKGVVYDAYVNPTDVTAAAAEQAAAAPQQEEVLVTERDVWKKEQLQPEKDDDAPQDLGELQEGSEEEDFDVPSGGGMMQQQVEEVATKKSKKVKDPLRDIFSFDEKPSKQKKAAKKAEKERKRAEKEARKAQQQQLQDHSSLATTGTAASPRSDETGPSPTNSALNQIAPTTAADITMATLEQQWAAHPHEATGAIRMPAGVGVEDLAQHIANVTNITKVQTIGAQFISAGKHATGFVLCHFTMAEQLSMKVRSASPELSQAIIHLLQTALF